MVHWAVDGAGHWLSRFCLIMPVTGWAKSNGFCAIHTGSLTCSLKTTSGQPLPVRFHSWTFVCIVVAPFPSPSKVTIFILTFLCVLAYCCAAGNLTESTHTTSGLELARATLCVPDALVLLPPAPTPRVSAATANKAVTIRPNGRRSANLSMTRIPLSFRLLEDRRRQCGVDNEVPQFSGIVRAVR